MPTRTNAQEMEEQESGGNKKSSKCTNSEMTSNKQFANENVKYKKKIYNLDSMLTQLCKIDKDLLPRKTKERAEKHHKCSKSKLSGKNGKVKEQNQRDRDHNKLESPTKHRNAKEKLNKIKERHGAGYPLDTKVSVSGAASRDSKDIPHEEKPTHRRKNDGFSQFARSPESTDAVSKQIIALNVNNVYIRKKKPSPKLSVKIPVLQEHFYPPSGSSEISEQTGVIYHDSEFEEDVLRRNVSAINIGNDEEDGLKFNNDIKINDRENNYLQTKVQETSACNRQKSSVEIPETLNICFSNLEPQQPAISNSKAAQLLQTSPEGNKNSLDHSKTFDHESKLLSKKEKCQDYLPTGKTNDLKQPHSPTCLFKADDFNAQGHAAVKESLPDLNEKGVVSEEQVTFRMTNNCQIKDTGVVMVGTPYYCIARGPKGAGSSKKSSSNTAIKDANGYNQKIEKLARVGKEACKTDIVKSKAKKGELMTKRNFNEKLHDQLKREAETKQKTNSEQMAYQSRKANQCITQPVSLQHKLDKESEKITRKNDGYYCSPSTPDSNLIVNSKEINGKVRVECLKQISPLEKETVKSLSSIGKHSSSRVSGKNKLNENYENSTGTTTGVRPLFLSSRNNEKKYISESPKNREKSQSHSQHHGREKANVKQQTHHRLKSAAKLSERSKCKVTHEEDIAVYGRSGKQQTNKGHKNELTKNPLNHQSNTRRPTAIPETSGWYPITPDNATEKQHKLKESKNRKTNGSRRIYHVTKPSTWLSISRSVSTDSSPSSLSSSVESPSSISYSSHSSTDDFQYGHGDGKNRNNNHAIVDGTPRNIVSVAPDSKTKNGKILHVNKNKSVRQRSASSSSSFQQSPLGAQSVRDKVKNEANKHRKRKEEKRPPRSPQEEKAFEPKFGSRRVKRNNGSALTEGEDSHSLWQHHQLVLVSQKPDKSADPKPTPRKTPQLKQSSDFPKTPALNAFGGYTENKSYTIRDMYSLHNVLSDTLNGTVISGYRRSDGLRVAIKRVAKSGNLRWGWLKSKIVPLELSLMCRVNETRCRGIVEIVEWHETTEAFLLVMVRPHPAVDLYDYVSKHKKIKETVAILIIQQLVVALQHSIRRGVLHRDIKLENILFNPTTNEITLIDFGCGDYIRSGSYKEFAGTPEYYPPEWFHRKKYDAEPMTAWSIGVLLYSLLCGALPFRSLKEITEKNPNKFSSDISRSARDLINGLLQKNPKRRLGLNEILSHEWLNSATKSSKKSAST